MPPKRKKNTQEPKQPPYKLNDGAKQTIFLDILVFTKYIYCFS